MTSGSLFFFPKSPCICFKIINCMLNFAKDGNYCNVYEWLEGHLVRLCEANDRADEIT